MLRQRRQGANRRSKTARKQAADQLFASRSYQVTRMHDADRRSKPKSPPESARDEAGNRKFSNEYKAPVWLTNGCHRLKGVAPRLAIALAGGHIPKIGIVR